jgi:uncharacterized membrane protein
VTTVLTLYTLFKYIHIVSAIVWIGSVITLSILNFRIVRSSNPQAVQALSKESNFYGRAIVGPAAALTLIAGIITATQMGVSFNSLWIVWGFVAIFFSLILGTTFTRITTNRLSHLTTTRANFQQVHSVQSRLAFLNSLDVFLLLSTVAAMVFKPIL